MVYIFVLGYNSMIYFNLNTKSDFVIKYKFVIQISNLLLVIYQTTHK